MPEYYSMLIFYGFGVYTAGPKHVDPEDSTIVGLWSLLSASYTISRLCVPELLETLDVLACMQGDGARTRNDRSF